MTALCFGVLLRVREEFRVRVKFRVRAEFRVRVGLRVWVGFRFRALQRNKRHESGYALVKDDQNIKDFLNNTQLETITRQ